MPGRDDQDESALSGRSILLRRADQLAVATLTLLGLGAIAGYWIVQGGYRARLIDVERVAPLEARFRVDVNEADWPELAQLPGVGETIARRIVETRRTQGPFVDEGDLQRVHGIGPQTVERLRPYLLPLPKAGAVAGN